MFIFNPVKPNCMNKRRTALSHRNFQEQNIIRVFSSQISLEKTLFGEFEREINTIVFLKKLAGIKKTKCDI
jgi:hypothetical protein